MGQACLPRWGRQEAFGFTSHTSGCAAQAGPDVASAGSPLLSCGLRFCVKAQLEQNPIKPPFAGSGWQTALPSYLACGSEIGTAGTG